MKLNWIRSEPVVRRPVRDIEELLHPTPRGSDDTGGVMGRDVETSITVERILNTREKYKKQAQAK